MPMPVPIVARAMEPLSLRLVEETSETKLVTVMKLVQSYRGGCPTAAPHVRVRPTTPFINTRTVYWRSARRMDFKSRSISHEEGGAVLADSSAA